MFLNLYLGELKKGFSKILTIIIAVIVILTSVIFLFVFKDLGDDTNAIDMSWIPRDAYIYTPERVEVELAEWDAELEKAEKEKKEQKFDYYSTMFVVGPNRIYECKANINMLEYIRDNELYNEPITYHNSIGTTGLLGGSFTGFGIKFVTAENYIAIVMGIVLSMLSLYGVIVGANILGKEFELGKNTSITPYGALRAMYVTRPTFDESGKEALEVEGNDAWSVRPRAGIELKTAVPVGKEWQLKGSLDFAYEYELADLNEREKARLTAVEDGYHNLSKPEEEKGTFRTRASVGVEIEDRYGIFINGEYSVGNKDQDDYRAGVTLKAVF